MKPLQNQLAPRSGFVLTEAIVSMGLIGLILGVASLLLTQHSRATEYFLNQRRAQLAAESCVERMRIGVLEVVDVTFTDEAGINFEIRVTDADAAWQPLRRVHVLAVIGGSASRAARYSLHAYVDSPKASRGAGS